MAEKRAKGKDYKLWFLIEGTESTPVFLMGQSSSNSNFDNATQTVSPLKTDAPWNTDASTAYQSRVDGIKDFTGSATFTKMQDVGANDALVLLFKKLKFSPDTTITLFDGYTEETGTGDSSVVKFTGFASRVLIKSVSIDYPVESEVSGTINFENSGTTPIEIEGKTWTEAVAAVKAAFGL